MIYKESNFYLSIIIGLIFFTYIVGMDIVNFSNIFWLIDCPIICDAQQHLLGWLFFRETDILQFPFLKNTSFGLYTGSSLIYTDSLPIFAIIFKFLILFQILNFNIFTGLCLWVLMSMHSNQRDYNSQLNYIRGGSKSVHRKVAAQSALQNLTVSCSA